MMRFNTLVSFAFILTVSLGLPRFGVAEEEAQVKEVIRVAVTDGKIKGQVFAMLDDQKAPLKGKVSLTDADGRTITASDTDDSGNFAFEDVTPGIYRAIGVAGDYVGGTEIEVTAAEGVYTSIPIAVAPSFSGAIYQTYDSLPAASFSTAPSYNYAGGHVISGGGASYGNGVSYGGRGLFSGGSRFRRLAIIGLGVGLGVGLSGGNDDPASPDN